MCVCVCERERESRLIWRGGEDSLYPVSGEEGRFYISTLPVQLSVSNTHTHTD